MRIGLANVPEVLARDSVVRNTVAYGFLEEPISFIPHTLKKITIPDGVSLGLLRVALLSTTSDPFLDKADFYRTKGRLLISLPTEQYEDIANSWVTVYGKSRRSGFTLRHHSYNNISRYDVGGLCFKKESTHQDDYSTDSASWVLVPNVVVPRLDLPEDFPLPLTWDFPDVEHLASFDGLHTPHIDLPPLVGPSSPMGISTLPTVHPTHREHPTVFPDRNFYDLCQAVEEELAAFPVPEITASSVPRIPHVPDPILREAFSRTSRQFQQEYYDHYMSQTPSADRVGCLPPNTPLDLLIPHVTKGNFYLEESLRSYGGSPTPNEPALWDYLYTTQFEGRSVPALSELHLALRCNPPSIPHGYSPHEVDCGSFMYPTSTFKMEFELFKKLVLLSSRGEAFFAKELPSSHTLHIYTDLPTWNYYELCRDILTRGAVCFVGEDHPTGALSSLLPGSFTPPNPTSTQQTVPPHTALGYLVDVYDRFYNAREDVSS